MLLAQSASTVRFLAVTSQVSSIISVSTPWAILVHTPTPALSQRQSLHPTLKTTLFYKTGFQVLFISYCFPLRINHSVYPNAHSNSVMPSTSPSQNHHTCFSSNTGNYASWILREKLPKTHTSQYNCSCPIPIWLSTDSLLIPILGGCLPPGGICVVVWVGEPALEYWIHRRKVGWRK